MPGLEREVDSSDLWLQISVANTLLVKDLESLEDLSRDLFRAGSRLLEILDVVAQVAILDILHREEDVVPVFVPSEKLDKQVFMLPTVSQVW